MRHGEVAEMHLTAIVLVIGMLLPPPIADSASRPLQLPSYSVDTCPQGFVALRVAAQSDSRSSSTALLFINVQKVFLDCDTIYAGEQGHDNRQAWCEILAERALIAAAAIYRDTNDASDEQSNLESAATDVPFIQQTNRITDPTLLDWISELQELLRTVPDGADVSWTEVLNS
jgi:hypothetical protein